MAIGQGAGGPGRQRPHARRVAPEPSAGRADARPDGGEVVAEVFHGFGLRPEALPGVPGGGFQMSASIHSTSPDEGSATRPG